MHKDNHSSQPIQVKIPEVRFNLKSKSDPNKATLISAVFRFNGTRLVYSTCKHVQPKYWNSKTHRAKESVNFIDGVEINHALDLIRNTIRTTYSEYVLPHKVSIQDFKTELDYRLGRKERPKVKTGNGKSFSEFIDYEIEKQKIRVNGKIGGQTWQKYQSMRDRLESFINESIYELEYDSLNESFKDDFVLHLENKGLSQNTISKDVETLKTLLKRSRKFHSNNYYNDPDFKVGRVKTTKHYPTLEELKHLYSFKFDNPVHKKVVDLYCISAFGGGLRISDVLTLKRENEERDENGNQYLRVFTYKGREVKSDNEVVIPFTPQLRELIDKYNWELPKFSEQHINETLKEAFAKAELKREKLMKSGVKGERPGLKKLCDIVHFHTARYAYIDYMINDLDVSAEQLQKITGQSLKVLLGYERGDKKKNALKVGTKINAQMKGLHVVRNEAV